MNSRFLNIILDISNTFVIFGILVFFDQNIVIYPKKIIYCCNEIDYRICRRRSKPMLLSLQSGSLRDVDTYVKTRRNESVIQKSQHL